MEKTLSASQRDQMYLKLARQELVLKENMVKGLTEASVQSSKAFEQMSKSIESVRKSFGDGLALLAVALASPTNQQGSRPSYHEAHPSYHDTHPSYHEAHPSYHRNSSPRIPNPQQQFPQRSNYGGESVLDLTYEKSQNSYQNL